MKDLINGPWTADANNCYFDIRDANGDGVGNTCPASCMLENGSHTSDPRTLAVTSLIVTAPELQDALESTTRELQGYIERENARLKAGINSNDLEEPDWHDMQTIHENDKLLAKARRRTIMSDETMNTCTGSCWSLDGDGDVEIDAGDGLSVFVSRQDLLAMLRAMDGEEQS